MQQKQFGSKKRLIVDPPSAAKRRKRLRRFQHLLTSKTTKKDWEEFFDTYPYVLSETLGMKFDGLFRHTRKMSGVPDYVFYRNSGPTLTGDYGVIELKHPDQPVPGTYATKQITPSKKLVPAQFQASRYLEDIRRGGFLNSDNFLVAGNRQYAFIIIGTSPEITKKCQTEILQNQFRQLLPPGFFLYPYDELLNILHTQTPPIIQVLFASSFEEKKRILRRTFTVFNRQGMHARPASLLVQLCNKFQSSIRIRKRKKVVDGKSIMGLLTLAAPYGSRLECIIQGPDAEALMESLDAYFNSWQKPTK